MARNHVWRYTLRLFHIFVIFRKDWKIHEKRDPESHVFWLENRPSGHKARLILQFLLFWGDSRNRWFFDVTGERPKIYKIRPWSVQGLERTQRGSCDGTRFRCKCPQGRTPRVYYQNTNTGIIKNRFENTGFIKTGYKKSESGSNTPMGRWPGEFFNRLPDHH